MSVVQSAGAKLYIGGTGVLASEASWLEVGEVTNLGDFGRKYTLVTHNPVGDRSTYKFKGAYDDGSLQLQMARVPDDAGQEVIVVALDSDEKYNFKVELDDSPTGTGAAPTTFKFKGLVMSYTSNVGSVNNIVQSMVEVQISGSIIETAAEAGSA